MATQKTMTAEEFDSQWRGVGRSRNATSMYAALFDALEELTPVPVTLGNDDIATRRATLRSAAITHFGSAKRIRTIIADGVLYACLMPESDNSK